MKNSSIIKIYGVEMKYRTLIGSEYLVKPDNFDKITSFSQRFIAALLVLSGKACAVKWDTVFNYSVKEIRSKEA